MRLTVSALPLWVLVVACGVLGLVTGSFANVAIHRWPRGGTVTSPRGSQCPACGHPIRGRDNVPLLSWMLLRGRCRDCGAPIAGRYPLVEGTVGLLWAALAAVHGWVAYLPAMLVLAWGLVVAAVIDVEHRIIPNRLTYRLAPIVLVLLVAAAVVDGATADLVRAIVAGIALPAAMFLLSELFRLLRGRMGIGMGDVKLAVSIGLGLGWLGGWEVLVGFYAAVVVAVLVAVPLLLTGRAKMASRIPFGPYLAGGSVIALLVGRAVGDAFGRWLGLS